MATTGKPITCRAAVAWEMNKPFSIETVEIAAPKKREVRLQMTSAGICHSDLHILEGINKNWPFPSVLGHEGAGIVESVGEGVTSIKPGDVAVPVFRSYCGECEYCKSPRTNHCKTHPKDPFHLDSTSRITCKGKHLSQMYTISTFCEYTVISENNVSKVNPKANPQTLCLAGCCIPSGYGAVVNRAKVTAGSTCAIWGLGGIGMSVVMACRDSGASKIIGLDPNPRKYDLAKELGCTEVVNPLEHNVPQKLAEMTNGGVDFCFVAVGAISAMEEAFNSSHYAWGKTVIIGLSDVGETVRAGIWELIYGRELIGSSFGGYKSKLGIPQLVDKMVNGEIQSDKLISHRLPLDQINKGFQMLKRGESMRAIIDFDLKE